LFRKKSQNTDTSSTGKFESAKQSDLSELLRQQRRKRLVLNSVIMLAVILALGCGYFFVFKPYSDSVKKALNFVKESERLASEGNYDEAITCLNKARLSAPSMKALYYRAGIIYMHKKMQMKPEDYQNAENMFKAEIKNRGYAAGAELALGFLYTVDGIIQDTEIPPETKAAIITELSKSLDFDITIKTELTSLGLTESEKYTSATNHFSNSLNSTKEFEQQASIGLAYANALSGSRDQGRQYFEMVTDIRDQFPILAKFYESKDPRLGVPSDESLQLFMQSQKLAMEGRYDEALGVLEDARMANPDFDGLSYYEGLIHLLKMDFTEAGKLFEQESTEDAYKAKSEIALGFLYLVDAVFREKSISLDARRAIIEEISEACQVDIALNSDMESLNLQGESGYSKAIEHFEKAKNNVSLSQTANSGLAYSYALNLDRDRGQEAYNNSGESGKNLPILKAFYAGNQPSLAYAAELKSEKPMEDLPIGELPPIPDNISIEPPPDLNMPETSKGEKPSWKPPRIFNIEPTVKPFKLSKYMGKDGKEKYIVTLLNIRDSGKTVAREGQSRVMPKTGVEIIVLKLSEDQIILKENNLHTFTWSRQQNAWTLSEKQTTKT
jgi:tetratricopeptide (TPR) repeat protein